MMMSVSVGGPSSSIEKPGTAKELFKKELSLRRASLTPRELGFLNGLIAEGTEDEIKKATRRLSDPDLFSVADTSSEDDSDDDSDDEVDALNDGHDHDGEEKTDKDPAIVNKKKLEHKGSSGNLSVSSMTIGSARRRESLAMRRGSMIHNQIWKAHEGGLAVSKQSSRRSLLVRSGSSAWTLNTHGSQESGALSRQASRRSSLAMSRQGSNFSLMSRQGSSRRLASMGKDLSIRNINVQNHLGGMSDSEDDDSDNEEEALEKSAQKFASASKFAAPGGRMFAAPPAINRRMFMNKSGSHRRVTVAGGAPTIARRRNSTLTATRDGAKNRRHTFGNERSASSKLMGIPEEEQHQHEKKKKRPSLQDMTVIEDSKKSTDYDGGEEETGVEVLLCLQTRRASVGEGIEVGVFMEIEEEDEDYESESDATADYSDDEEENDDAAAIDDVQMKLEEAEEEERKELARKKTMMLRRASMNVYNGEGMEISDWDAAEEMEGRRISLEKFHAMGSESELPHSAFFAEEEEVVTTAAIQKSASFDETQSEDRDIGFPEVEEAMATIQRCYSEDELASMLTVTREKRNRKRESCGTVSTEASDDDGSYGSFQYDAWLDSPQRGPNFMQKLPFRILGTSAEDVDSQPHVLSPPLMESLQSYFPFSKTSDNFWMKYSMVRDGASLHTLLQHARGSKHTILAIETVDGEVFGAFTNEPWRKTWSYFGGGESFLWRMRKSRKTQCLSIIDQAYLESEIDVYPYTGENHCVQFCTSRQIAVGGGAPDQASGSLSNISVEGSEGGSVREHEWGYGISLQSDLLQGTTAPCVTFGSPSLSKVHSDGSLFEIINIELWAMTPAFSAEDAEKLELSKLFLEEQSTCNANQSTESLNEYYS